MQRVLFMIAGLATVVLLGACGSERQVVVAGGYESFPAATLEDWVSYADHVAAYTVIAERADEPRADVVKYGEGYVAREVVLRIDATLWSASDAPILPSEIPMASLGWHQREEERVELIDRHGPRVRVGQRYVAPLAFVRVDHGGGLASEQWSALTNGSQLPLVGDEIASDGDWASALRDRLAGTSIGSLAQLLERQPADPLAQRHMDLRPLDRIQAVSSERLRPEP